MERSLIKLIKPTILEQNIKSKLKHSIMARLRVRPRLRNDPYSIYHHAIIYSANYIGLSI